MLVSESFGRHFWVDEDDQLRSAPSFTDNTADMDNADYVSEWTDWEGVNVENLLSIYKTELNNKWNYGGSITILNGV